MPTTSEKRCLFCQRDERATPLVVLTYGGESLHICPQHLPLLIHDPQRLIGVLPGAERLEPAEHHD
ncbi:MAG: hypothetical protein KDB94_09930 [Acidobacteria bacterium]|nr:hypothetical protein [Acidobacteriota bacterium]MCB9378139.1 hypothetical protein [Holophagales bacterium]